MHEDLKKATEVLKSGGVILFPNDVGWNLGCDATNEKAVEKLYRILKEEYAKNLVILMENPALLERYVTDVPEIAWELAEISITPLNLIFPKARNIASNLLGDDQSIAFRFTKEPFSMQLLQRFRRPVVTAPPVSGNDDSSAIFAEITEDIKVQVDYIAEHRQDETHTIRLPGIIKLWPGGRIDILRK